MTPKRGYSKPGRLPAGWGRGGERLPDSREFEGNIKVQLDDLTKRIEAIEQELADAKKEAEQVQTEAGTEEEPSPYKVRTIGVLYGARRALYGYTMLLDSMGLPKDQKQLIQNIHNITNMVIRLQQTFQMLDITMKMFQASNPLGWAMLVFSAGTLVGSIMYGVRGTGG